MGLCYNTTRNLWHFFFFFKMKAAEILILHKPFMNCIKVVGSLSGAAPPSLYTPVYTSARTSYFTAPYQAGDELKMQFLWF